MNVVWAEEMYVFIEVLKVYASLTFFEPVFTGPEPAEPLRRQQH